MCDQGPNLKESVLVLDATMCCCTTIQEVLCTILHILKFSSFRTNTLKNAL